MPPSRKQRRSWHRAPSPAGKVACFQEAVSREEMEASHPAQEVVVSIQALCRLSPRALDLGLLQPRLDGPNDPRGDLVLKVKNVVQRAVEAIGPDVSPGRRINQLSRDPHAVTWLAHTAFEHVSNAQLAPDQLYIHSAALIGEAEITGDNEKPVHARERCNDFLDDAVGQDLACPANFITRSPIRPLDRRHRYSAL
jgi:hypothetical protein